VEAAGVFGDVQVDLIETHIKAHFGEDMLRPDGFIEQAGVWKKMAGGTGGAGKDFIAGACRHGRNHRRIGGVNRESGQREQEEGEQGAALEMGFHVDGLNVQQNRVAQKRFFTCRTNLF
jgi:hypothetical protein